MSPRRHTSRLRDFALQLREMKMRYGVSLALVGIAILVTGCPKQTAIWVEEGSTSTRLLFRIASERGAEVPVNFQVLNVSRCESGERYWVISSTHEGVSPPLQVQYGVVPEGYATSVEAKPLGPGCYLASVIGTGRATFTIDDEGGIRAENTP